MSNRPPHAFLLVGLAMLSGCERQGELIAPADQVPAPSSTDLGAPPAPGTTRVAAGPTSTLAPVDPATAPVDPVDGPALVQPAPGPSIRTEGVRAPTASSASAR